MRQPPPRGTHAEWPNSQAPGVGRHSAAEPGSVKSERHLTVERRTAFRGGNYSAEPPRALGGRATRPVPRKRWQTRPCGSGSGTEDKHK